jgi:hypothetical protein
VEKGYHYLVAILGLIHLSGRDDEGTWYVVSRLYLCRHLYGGVNMDPRYVKYGKAVLPRGQRYLTLLRESLLSERNMFRTSQLLGEESHGRFGLLEWYLDSLENFELCRSEMRQV